MDGLWFSLLIIWMIVEGVQCFRKIPFPRRMIAPLVWVICVSGFISVGQAQKETGFEDALRFFVGALMGGVFGSLFYGFRLVLARIWCKPKKEDAQVEIESQISASVISPWAKRIIFSIALVLAGFASLAVAIAGYKKFQEKQEQIAWKALQDARQALSDAVIVTAYHPKDGCPESHSYAYQIENKSNEVVNLVQFNVLVRKVGFSNVINHVTDNYKTVTVDKILHPGDVWARCVNFHVAGYPYVSGSVTEKDVEFEIANKYVVFKNN